MKWNERKCIDFKCVQNPTKSRLTPWKQIQRLSRIKTLNGTTVHWISPVGKDLPKSQVFSSEWKTERVREDASGDREDGEEDDDELPCVIGESEGDCVW